MPVASGKRCKELLTHGRQRASKDFFLHQAKTVFSFNLATGFLRLAQSEKEHRAERAERCAEEHNTAAIVVGDAVENGRARSRRELRMRWIDITQPTMGGGGLSPFLFPPKDCGQIMANLPRDLVCGRRVLNRSWGDLCKANAFSGGEGCTCWPLTMLTEPKTAKLTPGHYIWSPAFLPGKRFEPN